MIATSFIIELLELFVIFFQDFVISIDNSIDRFLACKNIKKIADIIIRYRLRNKLRSYLEIHQILPWIIFEPRVVFDLL